MTKKSYYIFAIVAVTLMTTALHFATMRELSPDVVLEELYYLPLLLGVLRFGLSGAIATWFLVSVAYVPFFFAPWTMTLPDYVDRILHLLLSGVIAVVIALLIERERKGRRQAERERYLAGLGRVATVIVHDLKNPLISILGFARRLSEEKGDSVLAVQAITASAQSMQRIVNAVLDFAKPMQLDFRDVDIEELISRVVAVCRTKAAERGVPLVVNLPSAPISISVDSFHVERALVNLIDNAIDASRSGEEVVVTVREDKKGLCVAIKDCGKGMDSETLRHLFEPFYTTKSSGTGLGMPIAKKICEEHGGTLLITSQPGTGTEAKVLLPRSRKSGGIKSP